MIKNDGGDESASCMVSFLGPDIGGASDGGVKYIL